ncbi:MAG: ABC transporter ATP-binding protein [Erysipelotrichia bacterium]|nr:ABC transporter ATP-binding protein [Erysipelotrichia bacterium]NCC53892.1 ABC transporter ATP-binding protein [Erysipelotrichia bacterium]
MIEVKHLSKQYGKLKAVDDISLCAKPNKITILLGPNGAGKSTTIKSITNLLKFDGEVNICNHRNDTLEAKKSFGYIPEAPILYDLLTVEEHLAFITSAYRIHDWQTLANQYITMFELEDKRHTIAKELSKGMKQKLSMLLALIIQPKALLIDEPMVGLDPTSIEKTLSLLVELKNEGCSILISTHIIDVISDIWDEAYIMDKGKIVKHIERTSMKEETLKEVFFECIDGE